MRPRFALLAFCWTALACLGPASVWAQAGKAAARGTDDGRAPPAMAGATPLPASVQAALQRAKLPPSALHLVVLDPEARTPRLSHQAELPINPASLMKLVTTAAALDLLGPTHTWRTQVFVEGVIKDGVLQGALYLRGGGDPKLTVERLWLLLRRVQGLGIQRIQGDLVLDNTSFDLPPHDPASFDGEPLRPYNASPDALLLNFKSMLLHFVPDRAAQVARVHIEPPLAGVQYPTTVPLQSGDCSDYRSALRADFSDPQRVRFGGAYPAACGERIWPIAYSAPSQYATRLVQGLWQQLGGQLSGQVRLGKVPAHLQPVLQFDSPPLAEVVRDVNKFSNNVMAQQLLLSLSAQGATPGQFEASRQVVQRWWRDRIGGEPPIVDNGAGLSRDERLTAQDLARLLQWVWRSPFMPELASSLPLTGQDGTLKRSKAQAAAHLKTGSLRDVAGLAGYVDGAQGKRWILVVVLHHPQAQMGRAVLDAVVDWTAEQ